MISRIKKSIPILLCLYIFILAFLPSKFMLGPIPFNGDSFLFLIILFYIICAAAIKEVRNRCIKGIKAIPKDYFTIIFMAYIAVMFISVFYASDVKIAIKESMRAGTYFALYFIIKNEITDLETVKKFFLCSIVNIVALCTIGVVSYIFRFNIEVGKGGTRVESTFENSKNFAVFLLLFVFSIIFIAIKYKKHRVFYSILAVFMIINIVLTGSRNALLGLAIGCVLLTIFFNYKYLVYTIGLGACSLIIPGIRSRVFQIADMSENESRIKLWKIAVDIIKDHPIKGVGNGNYPVFYKIYEPKYHYIDYWPASNVHPHNILLKVQCEMGIMGTIIFIALMAMIFVSITRFIKTEGNVYFREYYKGFLISFIVFILMNMIDNFFSAPKVITYFWIFIAIFQCSAFKSELLKSKE